MGYGRKNLLSSLNFTSSSLKYYSTNSISSSIKAAIEAKTYNQIPDHFNSSQQSSQNPNPFSFLSTYPHTHISQIIDEILQSFIPIRPRSRPHVAYSHLLSFALQTQYPLPISFAILQRTLRSGCFPVPQTYLLLSSAWLNRRSQSQSQSQSVSSILSEMNAIGYHPDTGTCNYLISSLCEMGKLPEAVNVMKGMSGAGCFPDIESYSVVISAMCQLGRVGDAEDLIREMVGKIGLTPRQGTVVKVAATMRANKEILRAVEMIEFLEKNGFDVGFECYEMVVEGCLVSRKFILGAKVVMAMTEKGYIPYIKVRQKVVEGLASVGEFDLASSVRRRTC